MKQGLTYMILPLVDCQVVYQVLMQHILRWDAVLISYDIYIKGSNLTPPHELTTYRVTIAAEFYTPLLDIQHDGMTKHCNVLINS